MPAEFSSCSLGKHFQGETYTQTQAWMWHSQKHAWGLTLADMMSLYLDSLAAPWTRFQFIMNKDLFYALCCRREHIGYSIFSSLTFYNSGCEWMWDAGVHLERLWNHIPLSLWQYIRSAVNFLTTLGQGQISIMFIFNTAAAFVLPFFIWQTCFCPLSQTYGTAVLKIPKTN